MHLNLDPDINLDMRITGTTRLTGLIGNPVEHTVSPVLHNSLFNALGINGVYVPLRVRTGNLKDTVNGLKASGFIGFNITIPYKEEILDYIDEASEEVKLLGAANTVKIADGKLYGFNTDADGFIRAFQSQTGKGFKNKKVCILGAGGTAKALSVKIALEGAARVNIVNRTESRAIVLAAAVNKALMNSGTAAAAAFPVPAGSSEAAQLLSNCDIIVNTTSVGMHPDTDDSPIQKEFKFSSSQIVYDVIYNPASTKLMENAKAFGCKTINGAGMLYYQGLRSFEIWMDTNVPHEISTELSLKFLKYLEA